MDTYSLVHFVPAALVLIGCVAICVVGAGLLKKAIAKDAAAAEAKR